jgi:hypothetical protein
MAKDKQRTSMSLPTDVIEIIEEYQENEHLNNRSEAIERITRNHLADDESPPEAAGSTFLSTLGAVSLLGLGYGALVGQTDLALVSGVVALAYLLLVLSGQDRLLAERIGRFRSDIRSAEGLRETLGVAWSWWSAERLVDSPQTFVERLANLEIYIVPSLLLATVLTTAGAAFLRLAPRSVLEPAAVAVGVITLAALSVPLLCSVLSSLAVLTLSSERLKGRDTELGRGDKSEEMSR